MEGSIRIEKWGKRGRGKGSRRASEEEAERKEGSTRWSPSQVKIEIMAAESSKAHAKGLPVFIRDSRTTIHF